MQIGKPVVQCFGLLKVLQSQLSILGRLRTHPKLVGLFPAAKVGVGQFFPMKRSEGSAVLQVGGDRGKENIRTAVGCRAADVNQVPAKVAVDPL